MKFPESRKRRGTYVLALSASIFVVTAFGLILVIPLTVIGIKLVSFFGLVVGIYGLWAACSKEGAKQESALEQVEPVQTVVVTVAPPPPAAPPQPASNDQAVMLLSLLQEKGRFVDFVMEDVSAYSNEQVGAAARVIHQGCSELVRECFDPKPVVSLAENETITVPVNFKATEYKLTGKVVGQAPYSGTLVHKGWKASRVKLPRLSGALADPEAPVILPAEVELR
jgi:hypothetical protein